MNSAVGCREKKTNTAHTNYQPTHTNRVKTTHTPHAAPAPTEEPGTPQAHRTIPTLSPTSSRTWRGSSPMHCGSTDSSQRRTTHFNLARRTARSRDGSHLARVVRSKDTMIRKLSIPHRGTAQSKCFERDPTQTRQKSPPPCPSLSPRSTHAPILWPSLINQCHIQDSSPVESRP